jgi:leader peptidase (prepilin peptidase)/N-methyltransferase
MSALPVIPDLRIWLGCGLGASLLALSWIDIRRFILPDALTLPLIIGGLAACWWSTPTALPAHAAGAAAGYLSFRLIALAYRHIRNRDGLGQGDAKLAAAAGAWVAWEGLPSVVLLAAGAGLIVGSLLAFARRRLDARMPIPFGPCLALGLWVTWLFGPIAL